MMRFLISGVFAGLLLAGPALAQSNAADNKPADGNQKTGQASQSAAPKDSSTPAKPPATPPKDETMGNYDVTGSSANDAMGSAPP